jgi:hypothetical protein
MLKHFFRFSPLLALVLGLSAQAAPYVLLEPEAVGLPKNAAAPSNFLEYIRLFYSALLYLTIALAVVYIVIGGVQYMMSAAAGGKSAGRDRVYKAIQGLLLALISYLVLYTINPALVNWKLDICQIGTDGCPRPKETVIIKFGEF